MNKEEHRKRIGQRITEMRKSIKWKDAAGINRTGMTQVELGVRCGISQNHLTRIEHGYYSVGFDQLQAIATALGCNIDFVIQP